MSACLRNHIIISTQRIRSTRSTDRKHIRERDIQYYTFVTTELKPLKNSLLCDALQIVIQIQLARVVNHSSIHIDERDIGAGGLRHRVLLVLRVSGTVVTILFGGI